MQLHGSYEWIVFNWGNGVCVCEGTLLGRAGIQDILRIGVFFSEVATLRWFHCVPVATSPLIFCDTQTAAKAQFEIFVREKTISKHVYSI